MSHYRASIRACTAVALLALLTGCGRAGGQPFQPALNTPLRIDATNGIGQTLNPPGNTISRLDLSVATFGEPADPDGQLTVTLRPVQSPTPASTAHVSGAGITDGAWVTATFEPPVVDDGVMLAEVTWEGLTPLALWADVPLEGTTGIVNDPYPQGQLVVDRRPAAGDLAFRVRGGGGSDAARQLTQTITTSGGRLLDQPIFLLVWLVAIMATVVLALTGLRSRQVGQDRGRQDATPS